MPCFGAEESKPKPPANQAPASKKDPNKLSVLLIGAGESGKSM